MTCHAHAHGFAEQSCPQLPLRIVHHSFLPYTGESPEIDGAIVGEVLGGFRRTIIEPLPSGVFSSANKLD